MTIRVSTALLKKIMDGGAGGGVKGGLNLCWCNIYTGSQPASANAVITGTLLGTISIGGLGVTGMTWDAATGGVLPKAAAETWQASYVAVGVAGFFRFFLAADVASVATADATKVRLDGSCGTSGADMTLTNLTTAIGRIDTVDGFSVTLPSGE